MKVYIYLKENYGQITKEVPDKQITDFLKRIMEIGFVQITSKQHDYYPPSMILKITWESK